MVSTTPLVASALYQFRRDIAPNCEVAAAPHIPRGYVVVLLRQNTVTPVGKLVNIEGSTMGSASTITSTDLDTTRSRSLRRAAAIGAVAVAAANAAVWAAGRAADVSFLVTPLFGKAATQVGIVPVVLTTLIAFTVGMGLFALAARRSDRWARTVLAAGVLFAVYRRVARCRGPRTPLPAYSWRPCTC
jgi:Family of unknown function (DUF6069)